jgi:predicted esterase
MTECKPGPQALRILCLHGAGQSAKILEQRMAPIVRKLRKLATFVFVDAPYSSSSAPEEATTDGRECTCTCGGDNDDGESKDRKTEPVTPSPVPLLKRQWWSKKLIDLATSLWQYDTGKESIAFIEQCIADKGPFHACLGFSQGASALQVIPEATLNRSFTHLVFIGGYPLPTAIQGLTVNHNFRGKTLQVMGTSDTVVTHAKCLELSNLYPVATATVYSHNKGHVIPVNGEFAAVLRAFLSSSK